MFSSLLKKTFAKISIKLTLMYTLMLFLSSLLIFSLLYFHIRDMVMEYERMAAVSYADRLEADIVTHGPSYLSSEATVKSSLNPKMIAFYLDKEGTILWEKVPEGSKVDLGLFRTPMEERNSYESVSLDSSRDSVILVGRRINGEGYLLVGHNISSSVKFFISIRNFFWMLMIPVAIIGFICGLILSSRTMSSVRELITVIKKVERGSLSTRVPLRSENDEFGELKLMINKMLDRVEDLIGSLREAFDHLAHDIRTPVTRLRGRAEIALTSDGDLDSYREALESCYENSDKIVNFLQILSDITETENKSRKLKLEKIYVSDLIREVMELYEMAFEEKNIEFVPILEKNDWAFIDRKLISRVLANLLDNAHKYTPEGGKVTVEVENQTEYVKVRVKDSGPGIALEEQGLVFQKLYRSDKSRSEYGMGLGLTFVKAVVEAHDGKVAIKSPVENGRGTSFEITLQKMS